MYVLTLQQISFATAFWSGHLDPEWLNHMSLRQSSFLPNMTILDYYSLFRPSAKKWEFHLTLNTIASHFQLPPLPRQMKIVFYTCDIMETNEHGYLYTAAATTRLRCTPTSVKLDTSKCFTFSDVSLSVGGSKLRTDTVVYRFVLTI